MGKASQLWWKVERSLDYLCETPQGGGSIPDEQPSYVIRLYTYLLPTFPWLERGDHVHLPIYSPFITPLSGVKGHRWAKHWTNCSPRESCNVSTARGGAVFKAPNSAWDWPRFIVVSPKVPVSHLVDCIMSLLSTFDIHKIHKGRDTTLWSPLSQDFNTLHAPIPFKMLHNFLLSDMFG